jgi:dCTP deaminase
VQDFAAAGILSDNEIHRAVGNGRIQIDPFNPEHMNPTSYDLTLGNEVAVYKNWVCVPDPPVGPHSESSQSSFRDGRFLQPWNGLLDTKQAPDVHRFTIDSELGWVLKPGIGYLMHTRERIRTDCFIPVLDGKSSIGRLFVKVHETAGYGDPAFDGQYTLEVTAQHPIRVYAGMRFCQIRFHTIAGLVEKTYDKVGHYTREAAQGAVPSQAWKQFVSN